MKVGRFLSPLSPINTFYYAPVNISATLPMITNLHEAYPMTMDALSFNGVVGNDLKFGYNIFAGGYHNTINTETGALGFFGTESDYYYALSDGPYDLDFDALNSTLNFGYGVHAQLSFKDMVTLGYNYTTVDPENVDVYVKAYDATWTTKMKKTLVALISSLNITL